MPFGFSSPQLFLISLLFHAGLFDTVLYLRFFLFFFVDAAVEYTILRDNNREMKNYYYYYRNRVTFEYTLFVISECLIDLNITNNEFNSVFLNWELLIMWRRKCIKIYNI